MNVLGQYLDDRDDRAHQLTEADNRWLRERGGVDPAERLERWDRWVKAALLKALVWPKDSAKRERLLGQCAAELTVMVRQLRGRGWLLDGDALAGHVRAAIEPVGKAQQQGKVGDFWPYFKAAVARYVGAHAEEIQTHARRTGGDEGTQTIGAVLAGVVGRLRGPSMTELLAQRDAEVAQAKTLREQVAAKRREQACKAAADQAQLF